MKRNIIMGALVLAALCAFSTPAFAQRGRGGVGGGRGGYGGGRGGYGGGYGGYRGGYGGYRGGYGGFGVGLGTGLVVGSALGGYRGGYGGYGGFGGYGYAPAYGGYNSYGYAPSTTYIEPSAGYVDPGYPSLSAEQGDSFRESGYYAPQVADNTPQIADNAAQLRILAPADAKVWVGGIETGQTGTDRSFASPPLTPGKRYTYEVKARWMENGQPMERTRQVKVEANRTTTVSFDTLAESK